MTSKPTFRFSMAAIDRVILHAGRDENCPRLWEESRDLQSPPGIGMISRSGARSGI